MTISAATASDKDEAIDTLVMAFGTDPVLRWLYPSAQGYLAAFPALAGFFAARAFDHGSAYCIDGFAGVSLWLPPGVEPEEAPLAALLEGGVPGPEFETIMEIFERMGGCHPDAPHWYLPLMGVDPARQGQGLGSRLLEHVLGISDSAGLPAYLEATSEGNRVLYERHGFEVVDEIRVGSAPPVYPMLHAP